MLTLPKTVSTPRGPASILALNSGEFISACDRQPGNTLGKPLLVEKRWITGKETTIELVVPEEPKKAGIDPYNKLIDRAPRDNTRTIAIR